MARYLDGQLLDTITVCPFADFDEGCAVANHDRRHRKTGPTHPLVVLRCAVHQASFTVYPLGFRPYARRQLTDGPVQHDLPSLTDAVHDAAQHGPRERTPTGAPSGSWSTQNRLLQRVSTLFGLRCIDDMLAVATAAGIALTQLAAAADTTGVRHRAAALCGLITGCSTDDLLMLGALMGCWGRPHYWLDHRDQLVAMPLSRGPPMTLGPRQT